MAPRVHDRRPPLSYSGAYSARPVPEPPVLDPARAAAHARHDPRGVRFRIGRERRAPVHELRAEYLEVGVHQRVRAVGAAACARVAIGEDGANGPFAHPRGEGAGREDEDVRVGPKDPLVAQEQRLGAHEGANRSELVTGAGDVERDVVPSRRDLAQCRAPLRRERTVAVQVHVVCARPVGTPARQRGQVLGRPAGCKVDQPRHGVCTTLCFFRNVARSTCHTTVPMLIIVDARR